VFQVFRMCLEKGEGVLREEYPVFTCGNILTVSRFVSVFLL